MVTLTTDIPNDATHTFTLSVDAKDIGTTAEPPMTDYGPVEVSTTRRSRRSSSPTARATTWCDG